MEDPATSIDLSVINLSESLSSSVISANLSLNSAQCLTHTCYSSVNRSNQASNPQLTVNSTSDSTVLNSNHSVKTHMEAKKEPEINANQLNQSLISENSTYPSVNASVLKQTCNCRKSAPNLASNYAAFCANKAKRASECTVISANSSNQPSSSDTISENLTNQQSPSSPSDIISSVTTVNECVELNYDLNHDSVLLNDELFADVRPRFSLSQAFAEEDDGGFNTEHSINIEGDGDSSSRLRCVHDVRFSSCRVISGHNRGTSLDLSLINHQASNSSSFRSSFDDEEFRNTSCNGYGDVKRLHCHRRSSGSSSSGLGFLNKIKWGKLFSNGGNGIKKKIKASKVWIDESASETSGLSRQVSDSSLAVHLVRDAVTETAQRPLSICCAKPAAHHSAKVSSMATCLKQVEKQGSLSPAMAKRENREGKQSSSKIPLILSISDQREPIKGAKTPSKSKSETRDMKHGAKSPLILSSAKQGFKQWQESPLMASFTNHGIKKKDRPKSESMASFDQQSGSTSLIGSKRLMGSDAAVHLVRASSEAMSKKKQTQKKVNLFSQIKTKKTKKGLVVKLRAGRNQKLGQSQTSAANAGNGCDCSMDELHSAVQSAIAHCKLSMAS